MKTISVAKSFTFQHDDGRFQPFPPGSHEVEDHIADHWYVQAHTSTPPKPELKVGTQEYAKDQVKKIQRRRLLDAASEEAAEGEEES